MKKIIFSIAAIALTLNTIAGNGKHGDQYCARLKDGKVIVMYDETLVIADVKLTDGSTVKPDGTIIKKDGTQLNLQDGECINKDGSMPGGAKDPK